MKTNHSVRFDIGVYTHDESVGQIVGTMDLDFLPSLKDQFLFSLENGKNLNKYFREAHLILTVEKRFFTFSEGEIIKLITLSDFISKSIEECREVGLLMQEMYDFRFDDFISDA